MSPAPPVAEAPASLRGQILQTIKTFSVSQLLVSVCAALSGYFAARLLGPSQYGRIITAQIFFDYAVLLHLGVLYALHRDIPLFLGAGSAEKVSQTENVGFIFCLGVALPASAAFFCAGTLFGDPHMLRIFGAFSLALLLDFPLSFYTIRLRGHSQFGLLGRVQILTALSYLVIVALLFRFGLFGFLIGLLFRQSASFFYCARASDFKPALLWNNQRFSQMLSYGILIMLTTLMAQLMASADRLITLRFYGPESVAFLHLGRMVASPIMTMLIVAYGVLAPQYSLTYGKSARIQDLERFMLVPFRGVSIFSALSGGALLLAVPFLTESLLPQFRPGIVPAQILLFGLIVDTAITHGVGYLLFASGRQWIYLTVLAAGALVKLGILWAVAYRGLGIGAIAWGSLAAHLLLAVALYGVGLRLCGRRISEIAKGLLEFSMPFAYVLLCCLALIQVSGTLFGSVSSWKSVFFQEILFLLGTSFFLIKLLRELGIVKG